MNANEPRSFKDYQDTYVPRCFNIQKWLLNSELPAGAKMTYTVLACCAGGQDHAWPSQQYLAEKVSVSVRTMQRYLDKLRDFGLIEISRQFIKGQTRAVYRFLAHQAMGKKQHDKLSCCPEQKPAGPEKTVPAPGDNTTKTTDQHDKLSPIYKVMKEDRKEELPSTPQSAPATETSIAAGDAEVVGGDLQEKEESQEWLAVKNILAGEWPEFEFQAWIEPLTGRPDNGGLVLEAPNRFFLNHLKANYQAAIEEALKKAGLSRLKFELQSEETQAKIQARVDKPQPTVESESVPKAVVPLLSPQEQFQALVAEYPRKTQLWRAENIFKNLLSKGELPPLEVLIKAIKAQKVGDASWARDYGRWIPSLRKWLEDRRWLDSPYGG